jgi:hypothetical protein
MVVLKAVAQSVSRRLPNSLCPTGRIHSRPCGYKWSLLTFREGKYKGNIVGPTWNLEAESLLPFSRCF